MDLTRRNRRAFLLPRIASESPETIEGKKKKRIARLDQSVKAEHFIDWASKHREAPVSMNPLW